MNTLVMIATQLQDACWNENYDLLSTVGVAELLVEAVREADLHLTGKTNNRSHRDLDSARALLTGEDWWVYLSDGGYSRMCVQIADPESPSVGMDFGLSLDRPLSRWTEYLSTGRECDLLTR